ncbi:1884_t:CDS:2, partial [Funneliformis geosporum]
ATITYANDSNFKGLKDCYNLFVLNDIVRVHMCDQPHADILAHSKFSAKLAGLPRFTTDDIDATLSNENLTIDGKHVILTDLKVKLCVICSS